MRKDVNWYVRGIIFSELTWARLGTQIKKLSGAGVSYGRFPGGFFWDTM